MLNDYYVPREVLDHLDSLEFDEWIEEEFDALRRARAHSRLINLEKRKRAKARVERIARIRAMHNNKS